jgi:hypothetical protein
MECGSPLNDPQLYPHLLISNDPEILKGMFQKMVETWKVVGVWTLKLLALALLLLDQVSQFGYLVVDSASLGHQLPDLPIRMDDGRMVSATQFLADLWQ